MFKKLLTITVISLSALSLTACANTPKTSSTVHETTDTTAEGVLTAAVILSSGDIDTAVAEGIVTPSEVTAAKAAIESKTLDQWRQLAEK